MKKYLPDIGVALFLALGGAALWLMRAGRLGALPPWMLLVSAAGSAFVVRRSGAADAARGERCEWEPAGRRGVARRLLAAAAACAGAAVIGRTSWLAYHQWERYYFISLALYAAGIVIAGFGLDRIGPVAMRKRRPSRARFPEIALFILIIGTGAFMRGYRLQYFPPPDGIACCEEAQQGNRGYRLAYSGDRYWEFYESNLVTALSFKAFGPSMFALRLAAVTLASLTLIPFYFLARLLAGRRAALAAAFLFAVSRWHLCYARIAHNVFLPVFFVVLCICLLVRARSTARPSIFLWIGALAGMLMFSYAGYRGTIVIVLYYLCEKMLRAPWNRAAGEHGPAWFAGGIALVAVAAVAVSLPLFHRVGGDPRVYFEAAHRTRYSPGGEEGYYTTPDRRDYLMRRVRRLQDTVSFVTRAGGGDGPYNIPGEPMVDPLTALLLFSGLAAALATLRKDEHLFLAVLFLITVFLATIFVHNLDIVRLIGAIPLLYLLVAAFLALLFSLVDAKGSRVYSGLFAAALALLCLGAGGYNYVRFFGKQIADPRVRAAYKNHYTILVDRVRQAPPDAYVIVVSPVLDNLFRSIDLEWLRGFTVRGMCAGSLDEILPLPRYRRVIVIFQAPLDIRGLASRLEKSYPGARCRYLQDPDRPDLRLMECEILREEAAADSGGPVQFVEGFRGIGKYAQQSAAYSDYRGGAASWWVSANQAARCLSWTTAPVPEAKRTVFAFTASTAANCPLEGEIAVNGRRALAFRRGNDQRTARWDAGQFTLWYLPRGRHDGLCAVYLLSVPAEGVVPGAPNRIEVTLAAGPAPCWFMVFDRGDTARFEGLGPGAIEEIARFMPPGGGAP